MDFLHDLTWSSFRCFSFFHKFPWSFRFPPSHASFYLFSIQHIEREDFVVEIPGAAAIITMTAYDSTNQYITNPSKLPPKHSLIQKIICVHLHL